MTFLAPAAAAFGVIVPAIVALYFLKVRRTPVPVSSTLLWRSMIKDRQASVPWQRLRISWLLILQILAAIALVLALMRPAQSAPAPLAGHTIVLIDASATMQATDVHPSRFQEAKSQAAKLIGEVKAGDRMTLMVLDGNPRVVADSVGNQGPLRHALDTLQPGDGPADLQGALALAASVSGSGTDTQLVVLSDGITEPVVAPVALPFQVTFHAIGASGEDLAITALSAQPGDTGQQAFAHVQNTGRQRRSATVNLSVDGRLTNARTIALDGGAGQDLTFPLPPGAQQLHATLDPGDAFALDDSAWALARPARGYRVLLVSNGNVFLQQALSLVPGITVTSVSATASAYSAEPPADLYVFDQFTPPTLPAAPVLLVDPPSGAAGAMGNAFSPGPLEPAGPNPLLTGLTLSDVHVAAAHDLTKSGFGQPLITSPGGPVVELRQPPAAPARGVLIGFDLHESDLPLRTAFPVLIDRLTGWLLPQTTQATYHPGDEVGIAETGSDLGVIRPNGHLDALTAAQPLVFADTGTPGVYTVVRVSGGSRSTLSRFVVNAVPAPIAPVPQLTLAQGAGGPRAARRSQRTEWWPWAAAAALVLLTAEWAVFHRGL
ncbi:MAG TPA: BatA and WFA domain-containing protein [Actinomycetota bacterium]|nr:BatA and WFA domain-containing protein [Actinomycetota bacterium]